jgi:uncharacterized LabA/DUF88 family protein
VVSTVRSQPPMVADELRRQADNFIELVDIQQEIQRRSDHNQDRNQSAPADDYNSEVEIA